MPTTTSLIWPIEALIPTSGKSKIRAATISGGRSLSGLEQIVQNDAGFWFLTMGGIIIGTDEQLRLWNAIEAHAQGRSGTFLVPFLDCSRQPWPIVGGHGVTSYGSIPFSDDAFFDDGSGFYQPVVDAETDGIIDARAVTGNIRISYGGALKAGMHFSAGERGYRIRRVLDTTDEGGGVFLYEVTFWPPAREQIADAADLDFDRPKFRARLATDTEMDFDPDQCRHGAPTVNFTEDV